MVNTIVVFIHHLTPIMWMVKCTKLQAPPLGAIRYCNKCIMMMRYFMMNDHLWELMLGDDCINQGFTGKRSTEEMVEWVEDNDNK